MSKFVTTSFLPLFALAGLGLAMTGCGGGDDGEPGFGLRWDLRLIGDNITVGCDDAGTPTVNLDTMGANGFTSHDSFPCSTMSGTSTVLPRGTYQVTVSLQNLSGQVVSATQSTFDIRHGGLTLLPDLTFDIQSFAVNWTIKKANQPATCGDANAATVKLVTMAGDAKPINYMFPCSDRGGDTTAIPLGLYLVQVQLLDASGNVLATTDPMSVTADSRSRVVLPTIDFTVN
jgi:hypothetical protein